MAVVSRRRLYRDLIVTCLTGHEDFRVVGHVGRGTDLVDLCALHRPRLVVCDAGTDLRGAFQALGELRARLGRVPRVVVVHEAPPAAVDWAEAWRVGVAKLVPCAQGLGTLLALLRECADGRGESPPNGAGGLTDDERVLVSLVAAGYPADRIGSLLGITGRAVENRKRRIYRKLRAVSQSHLIARIAALGLLSSPLGGVPPGGEVLPLTGRETQILQSIAAGHTVRQTARWLGVATKTVENTQARLFRKLGCPNRAAALARAYDLGLLEVPDGAVTRPPPR